MSVVKLFIIFSVIVFTGCEKDATNVKVPDFVQKLVVQGFISPEDTTIMIVISKNIPIYGDQTPPGEVHDATVTLSNGDQTVQMVYTKNGEYKVTDKSFVLKHGETYHLGISTPGGLSANATCNIPRLEDWQVTLDTMLGYYYDIYNKLHKHYGFKITDTPGEKNYYRVNSLVYYYITEIQIRVPVNDTIIDTLHYVKKVFVGFKNDLLTDWGADGKIIEVITNEDKDPYYSDPFPFMSLTLSENEHIDSVTAKFYLYHIDYEYYTYHKTISNYIPDDDPFGEPVPIYSNIDGGFGIFCSYAKKEYRFKIK